MDKNLITTKKVNFVANLFLCIFPFIVAIAAGIRPLRIPVVNQIIGGLLFALGLITAWKLGAGMIVSVEEKARRIVLSGFLFVAPFLLISLLWVGLGTPWEATASENVMRYLVLLFSAISVTIAFIILKEIQNDSGERFYSILGFSLNILAGSAYLIWMSFQVGAHAAKGRDGQISSAIVAMDGVFDILLFAACTLTYLTTAAFAASLGKTAMLNRSSARTYIIVSLIALFFLVLRGLSFPDPTADTTPWYLRPGFIAGIPAIPWLMPFLLGVSLLRHAGNDKSDG